MLFFDRSRVYMFRNNVDYRHNYMMRMMVVLMTVLMILSMMTTFGINGVYAAAPVANADSYVVMSASTGEVVYGEHENRKLQMAGTAKLMTAMVVIDRMHDDKEYDNNIQISTDVAKHGDYLKAGDKVSVRDLMYLLLMGDSNEAAEALAIYSAGADTAFVDCMNSRAKELGLVSTNYNNVTGKFSQKQFSTALDTAKILRAAADYPVINEILSSSRHTIEIKGKSKDKTKDFTLTSKIKINTAGLSISKEIPADNQAGNMYYGYASQNGMNMVVIMFNSVPDTTEADAAALFKYGYDNVTMQPIIKAGKEVAKAKIKHGASTRVPLYTKTKGYVYVPKEGSESLINTNIVTYKHLEAPIKAGTIAGEYRIYVADEYQGKVDLVVKEDVPVGWFPSYIYISNTATVIIIIILMILIAFVLRVRAVKKRREKRRRLERQRKIREIAERELAIEQDRIRRNWTYR